nr:diacylglycerol kinase family protein [Rhabdothermincola salaria]
MVVGSTSAGSSGRELIETVAGRLAGDGPTEVAVTSSPEDLDDALGHLGDRTLVAVGGDGSAHVVVNALERVGLLSSATVGFVPLGTANDFATHLGMSAEPREAADQLRHGHRRAVDLMAVSDGGHAAELVVNAVHAGLGVLGAERATPLKPFLGRLAYPVGVAATGAVYRGLRSRVRIDGQAVDVDGPLLALAVANAPRLGGVELVPGADITDGALDVIVVPARPWVARLRAVRHAAGRDTDAVTVTRARTVELDGDVGELNADGEAIDVGGSCRIEIRPGALRVLCPTP